MTQIPFYRFMTSVIQVKYILFMLFINILLEDDPDPNS